MILNIVSSGYEDYYSLTIYTNSGAEVVVENKYATYTKVADKMGTVAFCVTEGSWNIVSTKDGQSKMASINVIKDNILDMMLTYYPEFEYDGEYEIINEGEMNWHIKFKTSGTLNFSNLNNVVDGIEVFLVGGGANGSSGGSGGAGNGGNGGATRTETVTLSRDTNYQIIIGAGNEATSGFGFTASAGGGAKGGRAGWIESASPHGYAGGDGTYAFNDTAYARYGAGGGGGAGAWDGAYGSAGRGGDYGGGNGGGANASGGNGLANTGGGGGGGGWSMGGGGAGGSGIVIIRNKRS